MSGACLRLLAAFSLILVASALLRGQDAAAYPSSNGTQLLQPRYTPLLAPVRPPLPPSVPRHYPISPNPMPLQPMAQAAGIIFSGRVTAVEHAGSFSGQSPISTSVTFQVERAIRGTTTGQSLTIHEWAALWINGERYRIGERVLLFLYAPSKLGLTSPVAGAMGRFAIDAQGRIVMGPQHVETFAADPLLGGKIAVPYADFAQAVRRASGEE
jgi:hypothetical protein